MPRITAKPATRSHVPPLKVGIATTSNALHRLRYSGPLTRWMNFVQDVENNDKAQVWRKQTIRLEQKNNAFQDDHFQVGDEAGVQSRFTQHYGEELGRIFEAQGIDVLFSDFKSLGLGYENTPDSALKTQGNELKAVGEIKVPWIKAHQPSRAYEYDDVLRRLLSQPIQYMQDLNCAYGFYTTYDETIFLRQVLVNGVWEIQYSPCVLAKYRYQETTPSTTPIVSVKQCFLYVATLARQQGPLAYNVAAPAWVETY
ncbi:hypothetical protein N7527_005722 [Penicillium freii]|nr:hypothetical protein N7527_005722 [Penicillium freii]